MAVGSDELVSAVFRAGEGRGRGEWRSAAFRQILDALPTYVFVAEDPDCQVMHGNRATELLLRVPAGGNVSASQPHAETCRNFEAFDRHGQPIPPHDLPVQRAARGESISGYECELRFPDGQRTWLLGNAEPLRDDSGAVWGAVGAFSDITARKRAEQQLQQSERRYRGLVESQTEAVICIDRAGILTFVNETACAVMALPRDRLLGSPWAQYVDPDDVAAAAAAIADSLSAMDRRTSVQVRLRTPHGPRWFHWEGVAVSEVAGIPTELQAVGRDITEQREVGRKLGLALESASAGQWAFDPLAREGWTDPSCARLHGVNKDSADMAECLAAIHPDDLPHVLATMAASAALDGGEDYHVSYRVAQQGGACRWITSRGKVERDQVGRPKLIRGMAFDVTAAKAAEQALIEAKQVAELATVAKNTFLASASHDLRQPFQAMELYVDILSAQVSDPVQRKAVVALSEALASGRALLNALLDLSTLEAGTVRPTVAVIPLAEVIEPLRNEFAAQAAAKGLRFHYAGYSAMVRTDRVLLARMVRNLLSNALKYTLSGGILLGCRRRADAIRIEVWDTGPGIPDHSLGEIFNEFVQLNNPERCREKGLGIGLAVVAKTAHLLGCRIDVRSRGGHGSVFAIEVPLYAPAGM